MLLNLGFTLLRSLLIIKHLWCTQDHKGALPGFSQEWCKTLLEGMNCATPPEQNRLSTILAPKFFTYHAISLIRYRVLHIYWAVFNDPPFLSQLTQEKVMHIFRKPWILAIESNYETENKYVMGGSRRVLVNLLEFSFLRWILITHHF